MTIPRLSGSLLTGALVSALFGFSGLVNAALDGVGKALFGVLLSLYLIVRFFGDEK